MSNSLFCGDLNWTDLVSTDDLFSLYDTQLTSLIDKHAPRYVRRRKRHILTPWFDHECRQFKRNVRRLERRYRKTYDQADRLQWILKLREQAALHKQKENAYWSLRIMANSNDSRRLWRDLDELMRRDGSTNIVQSEPDAVQRADDFVKFFQQKVESIRKETEHAGCPYFEPAPNTDKLLSFVSTSVSQVVRLINGAPNKQCVLDPVPMTVLKKCSDLLSPYIVLCLNRSLQEGYVPSSLKISCIIPRLKKIGLDNDDAKNYRPVSNLSFLSKLLERIVFQQLNNFLDTTAALPSTQSAYRRGFSTESALLKVFSDLCDAVDRGHVCLLGLLDLSSAFDTVDHGILLNRISSSFGIHDTPLQWIRSYLSNRVQFVSVQGHHSSSSALSCGIPQGSVLGPLLFILYTAPISGIIRSHGLFSHSYADDTQVYFCCAPDEVDRLLVNFSQCIDDLRRWLSVNRLKVNCDKTEVTWITSKHGKNTISRLSEPLVISDCLVHPSSSCRNLGVFFDNELNMRQHINAVCRQCYFQLRQIRVIKRSLPIDVLKTLLHAFVSSRLDYCNSLFFGLPKCDINKLQRVQNAAARLIGGLARFDHVTPVMRDTLHWLPIKQRIVFKIATLTFKCLAGQAPEYLQTLCLPVSSSQFLSRNRSASRGDLIEPQCKTKRFGQRSFRYSAANVWNSLPFNIRREQSLYTFRNQLKTYLFTQSYYL